MTVEDKKSKSFQHLDLIPNRLIEHELDENKKVVLLRPRYMKGLLSKFVQPRIKNKYYRVSLDDFGSETWQAVDGKRTISQIADLLEGKFGEAVKPCEERCYLFFCSLQQGGMIELKEPSAG